MDTKFKVSKCSQCKRDHEFYCRTCTKRLCVLCKEKHLIDLDFQYHDVVIDRFKSGDFMKPKSCDRHQNRYVNKWCSSCEFPICSECDGHPNHEILDIFAAFKMCRHENKNRIVHIRTDIIYNNLAILAKMKSDVNTSGKIYQSILSGVQQSKTEQSRRLKNMVDLVVKNICESKQLKIFLKSRLKEQKKNITITEFFLHKLIQLLDKPVQFLMYLKKTPTPKITDISDQFSFSLNCDIGSMDLMKFIGEIEISQRGLKKEVRSEELLELVHKPVLKQSFRLKDACAVLHISCMTTDQMWISDSYGRIILTNTTGDPLHIVTDALSFTGGHTVNREGNLIYIDRYNNINKLSTDNKTINILEQNTDQWIADCVYSSPSDGDLLVGMIKYKGIIDIYTDARVMRYSSTEQQIDVIDHDHKGGKLYKFPKYLTENHNGDVIVSDLNNGVVVTDRTGRHRFSYTGPPSGSRLEPLGICVDALSNILVCDDESKTIQMIDKDGHFLSLLFTEQNEINVSGGLAYDNKNHLLMVGTTDDNNRVCAYTL